MVWVIIGLLAVMVLVGAAAVLFFAFVPKAGG